MPIISAATKTALEARRARYVTMLEASYDQFETLMGERIKRYEFVSAEGRQKAEKLDVSKILEQVRQLEGMIDSIDQRLRGSGISSMNLNRYGGGC